MDVLDGIFSVIDLLDLPDEDPRIVSLVPSLTELIVDLGLKDCLVGRTHYCVHPADKIADIPSMGGTKRINMARLADVKPTHVLVNVDENPKELADEIAATGIKVVVSHPNGPEDNLVLYRQMGELFGAKISATDMCQRFETALTELKSAAANIPPKNVLYLIWKDPWMTISRDTYISRMLGLINWKTVAHDPDNRYPKVDMEAVLPDTNLVLMSTEPYEFSDKDLQEFNSHRADMPVQMIDGEMTSWYGSRAIAGLQYLKSLI